MFRECLLKKYISLNGRTINSELALSLVEEMPVTDGSYRKTGEHFTYEDARKIGEKLYIDFTEIKLSEWYVVLNMMYKDHYKTACLFNLQDDSMFYAALADDWFSDVDAEPDKTFNFFMSD